MLFANWWRTVLWPLTLTSCPWSARCAWTPLVSITNICTQHPLFTHKCRCKITFILACYGVRSICVAKCSKGMRQRRQEVVVNYAIPRGKRRKSCRELQLKAYLALAHSTCSWYCTPPHTRVLRHTHWFLTAVHAPFGRLSRSRSRSHPAYLPLLMCMSSYFLAQCLKAACSVFCMKKNLVKRSVSRALSIPLATMQSVLYFFTS